MSTRVEFPLSQVTPEPEQVLTALGAAGAPNSGRHLRLAVEAIALYRKRVQPLGVWNPIGLDEFEKLYAGQNAGFTPLGQIYPRARSLALFAVTLGEPIRDEIDSRFQAADFALGAALDAAASEGAELAASELEWRYVEHLRASGELTTDMGVMRFSPGYCGWQTCGQRNLFSHLQPADIGISLSASCLMYPLKSVSGVIVAAGRGAFLFADDFPFCGDCQTRSCRERIAAIFGGLHDTQDMREQP